MQNISPENSYSTIESPCKGVCTLNENKVCMGCFRKLDEIIHWSHYNSFQRGEIIKMTQLRMQLPEIFKD